jgi:hypothetical protein
VQSGLLNDDRFEDEGMVEAARRRYGPADVRITDSAIYSSKIIKAGALLADTKTLLTVRSNSSAASRALCAQDIRRDRAA